MSDMIATLMRDIGSLRGGSFSLYKPVVRVEFFEHDEESTVEVGRCKGMEEIVLRVTSGLGVEHALVETFKKLKDSGAT